MAPIDICLPLLKYSWADTESTSSPIDWSHFSAVDLCVLVQGEDTGHGKLSLSIVDRTTYKVLTHSLSTLQRVCLTMLTCTSGNSRYCSLCHLGQRCAIGCPAKGCCHSDRAVANLWHHQGCFAGPEVSFAGRQSACYVRLHRERNVADKSQARRIQLRLQDEAQCQKLVDILQRRGLEFQAQRPRTGRPDTALNRLDTPTNEAHMRTTQQGLVQPAHNQVAQSPFQPPSMGFGSLTQHPPSSSYQDSATFSSSPLAAPEEYFRRKGQGAQIQGRAHPSHNQSLAKSLLAGPLPTTFPPHQSNAIGTDMQFSTLSSLPAPRAALECNTKPEFETNDSTVMAARSKNEAHPTAAERAYLAGTFSSDIPAPPLISSSSGWQLSTNRQGAADNGILKTTSHSRPSSALELPPLQMPKILEARPTSALQHSVPVLTEKRPQAAQAQEQEPLVQPNSTNNQSPHPQLASPTSLGNTGHTRTNPCPLEQLIFGSRTTAQRQIGKSIPRVSSLLDAPHEIEETPEIIAKATVQQNHSQGSMRLGNGQAMLNSNTASTGNVPPPADEASVQTYAAQRPQARDAALNKFMIDHLQDPAFTVLCADVEGCWRRIALGL